MVSVAQHLEPHWLWYTNRIYYKRIKENDNNKVMQTAIHKTMFTFNQGNECDFSRFANYLK